MGSERTLVYRWTFWGLIVLRLIGTVPAAVIYGTGVLSIVAAKDPSPMLGLYLLLLPSATSLRQMLDGRDPDLSRVHELVRRVRDPEPYGMARTE